MTALSTEILENDSNKYGSTNTLPKQVESYKSLKQISQNINLDSPKGALY